jgi:predicted dienelactone hydrolase
MFVRRMQCPDSPSAGHALSSHWEWVMQIRSVVLRSVFPALLTCLLSLTSNAFAVGYQHLSVADPTGAPIEIGVWYPSFAPVQKTPLQLFEQDVAPDATIDGGESAGAVDRTASGPNLLPSLFPLVVISHGSGGSYSGHYDTALALARAGFVVVAPTHTGDNYRDQSRELSIWDRPRQISVVLDYMLQQWAGHDRIDAKRIGMFGFSAGGFTTLAIVGGVPDFSRVAAHCKEHPEEWTCQHVAHAGASQPMVRPANQDLRDARVKVAVIAAPALGYTFVPDGLSRVRVPIQLWRAEDDHILPHPWYAEPVRAGLPVAPEYHLVSGAGHFDFLAPCSASLAALVPDVCSDPTGFDRVAFHQTLNEEVVRFFSQYLLGTQSLAGS